MYVREFCVLSVREFTGSTLVCIETDARKNSTEHKFFIPNWGGFWIKGAKYRKTVERVTMRTNEPQTVFVDSNGLYRIHYERL